MTYAATTTVPVERSKAEIEKTLLKYGASGYGSMSEGHRACIIFGLEDRRIKIILQTASPNSFQTQKKYEQAQRSLWRCALLVIKGKLESIESGIETVEEAFMPHILLPDGKTVGQVMAPQLEHSYSTGKMPPLLGYSG